LIEQEMTNMPDASFYHNQPHPDYSHLAPIEPADLDLVFNWMIAHNWSESGSHIVIEHIASMDDPAFTRYMIRKSAKSSGVGIETKWVRGRNPFPKKRTKTDE
jgi:hypothetical protein